MSQRNIIAAALVASSAGGDSLFYCFCGFRLITRRQRPQGGGGGGGHYQGRARGCNFPKTCSSNNHLSEEDGRASRYFLSGMPDPPPPPDNGPLHMLYSILSQDNNKSQHITQLLPGEETQLFRVCASATLAYTYCYACSRTCEKPWPRRAQLRGRTAIFHLAN